MTTYPDMLYHLGGVPVGGMLTQGRPLFVRPYDGSNGNTGRGVTTQKAVKTLAKALSLATADQNDVVYLCAQSDTAANTTDYQSTALDWNKDLTHLIGINAGNAISQRSRIAQLSTATNVDNLFTLSADGCRVENVQVFHGVADATSTVAVLVSGNRNHFVNCHLAGIGHATQDVATNCSLKITGSENLFEDCVIGLDTISRATATYEMTFAGGAARNLFRRCIIMSYAGAAAFTFLTVAANGIDRWNMFEDCIFVNMPTGIAAGTTMNQAFSVTGGGSPDGCIILKDCKFAGVTASETVAGGKVLYFANGTGKMVATAF